MVHVPFVPALSAAPTRWRSRRWSRTWRRVRNAETTHALLLGAMSSVLAVAAVLWPQAVPVTVLVLPLVVGHLMLGPRTLPWLVGFTLAVLAGVVAGVVGDPDLIPDDRRPGGVLVVSVVGILVLIAARRSRLGVTGNRGESMLVDLRDRISKQSHLPALPAEWYAEAVLRSAGGSAFAGDFVVASKAPGGRFLEVAVVDVSGKGEQAGTRALLLSGAFGGLLGALPPEGFLPAANEYLLRQDWSEGFATAVHLSLDLETGEFEVRSAGHPPAVQLRAGSGRWVVHEVEGPVLGLIAATQFPVLRGRMEYGDALLLYTDGLVETPQRDISLGIDKLLGQGERLLRLGFEDGARRMIDELESMNDDRALLLLHRR